MLGHGHAERVGGGRAAVAVGGRLVVHVAVGLDALGRDGRPLLLLALLVQATVATRLDVLVDPAQGAHVTPRRRALLGQDEQGDLDQYFKYRNQHYSVNELKTLISNLEKLSSVPE